MTSTQARPWSQVDEELHECGASILDSIAKEPSPTPPRAVDEAHDDQARSPDSRLAGHIYITPNTAMIPMALAAGGTFWGAIHPAPDHAILHTIAAISIGALVIASGYVLVRSLRARREAMVRFCHELRRGDVSLSSRIEAGRLNPEFAPLWSAMRYHTQQAESRMAALANEHKQVSLERNLIETRKRQTEAVIDAIADCVMVIDPFDRLVLANPAAEALFGFERSEALRRPISEVLSDEALREAVRHVREAGGRSSRRIEHEIGDNSYLVLLSEVSDETADGEERTNGHNIVMILRDITKDKEVARMKNEFVANASHELRTPLSSIRAYVEMLVDGEAADEETRTEYYNIIQVSSERLGRMIDNMLNISRIESGTVRINKEPVAVSMIVKEALDVTRPQAEEKRIELTEELTPVMFRINADRDLIYQAMLNLLSNAVKYTPEGGKVHVRVSPHEKDQSITIEVRDTGVGIPEEDLPRMFEKFFRVEANKKMAKGTGLGLNLVKHIVESVHGGRLTLVSKVDEGSTFGMVLPLMSEHAPDAEQA